MNSLPVCVRCGGRFKPHHRNSTVCAACDVGPRRPSHVPHPFERIEATCPECRGKFMAKKDQVYCCKACGGARSHRRYQADAEYRVHQLHQTHENRAPGEMPSESRLLEMLDAAISSGHCPYCGRAVTERDWALDHIIPVSRGGTNLGSNLLFVCFGCNSAKGGKPLDEFLMHSLPHTLAESDAGAADGTIPGRGAKSAQGELA